MENEMAARQIGLSMQVPGSSKPAPAPAKK